VKGIVIAHENYPLVYSNIVPGEMDLNHIPEGVTPVALTNKIEDTDKESFPSQ
jgi:hypothetical protein